MPTVGNLASIEDALMTYLGTLVLSPTVPVAWPDMPFTPTPGQTYLEPLFLPNQTDLAAIGTGAPERHRGLLQVMVHGVLGQGAIVNAEIADAVIEHFKYQLIDASGVRVRIGSYDGGPGVPWRTAAIRSDVSSNIPVTIPWWCDIF